MLNLTASPSTITGVVIDTMRPKGRAAYSPVGNPNFDVTILLSEIDGTPVEASSNDLRTVIVRTAPNSGIAYGITNPEYKLERHVFNLTKAGKITSAYKAAR